ncbi:hypothetical protein SDC9_176073 [bioreactor metagenome]|uniref:Uncharacterized protein n=1 Tax=bioreactor metagenome TaxID=1076179 RepID=A0A645GQX5_9ZZZZ
MRVDGEGQVGRVDRQRDHRGGGEADRAVRPEGGDDRDPARMTPEDRLEVLDAHTVVPRTLLKTCHGSFLSSVAAVPPSSNGSGHL